MSPAGGPPAAGGAGPFPRPPHHGAPVGFATIHGKDLVVGAVLAGIGLRVVAVPFDTDSLGTFSGEVERTASPIEVVRTKATAGAAAVGRLGLGSEGTFAPDPVLPLTLDTEIVGILDADSGVLVVGRATAPAPWAPTAAATSLAATLTHSTVSANSRAFVSISRVVLDTLPSDASANTQILETVMSQSSSLGSGLR